jgi:short-subunit dehydrogenase
MPHVAITGASSGIGAALARVYSRWGWRLSLIARNAERLEAVAAACRRDGAEVDVCRADVTDAAAIGQMITACDLRQPVDLLIANAGIGALASDTGEPDGIARQILMTNALGVVNTVTPLLPRLVARRGGHVAIMSSLAGLAGLPACPAYSASKAAAYAYGAALRRLLAPSGVKVSIICPGFIDTPLIAPLPRRLPFVWTADRAAFHMARALARGRREIFFPWPLAVVLRVVAVLPAGVADPILIRAARAPR